MLPVIIGIGAIFLLSSCSRNEEPSESNSQAPRRTLETNPSSSNATPPSSASTNRLGEQWQNNRTRSALIPFDASACNPNLAALERLAVQDARQEFCRLHTLLTGGTCSVTATGVQTGAAQTPTNSLFSLAARMHSQNDYTLAQRDAGLVRQMAGLEGLPLYLADGQSCQFDTVADLQNLVAAYSLLLTTSRSSRWQATFQRGAMGCLMRSREVQFVGTHVHQVEGNQVSHQSNESHRLLLTPAHLTANYRSSNPGFPVLDQDTPVSDCIEVR